ncbi:hypothetical protein ACFU5O_35330 [Streptomyces sp. NPDC057445]|uniref:hypothetical protein n=1 Tax=Streptomyces sp. NPDC057445 TaxID=3346136 RepID=UPI0036C900A9
MAVDPDDPDDEAAYGVPRILMCAGEQAVRLASDITGPGPRACTVPMPTTSPPSSKDRQGRGRGGRHRRRQRGPRARLDAADDAACPPRDHWQRIGSQLLPPA